MPTARAIPSSPRRSAASITKIRKISRMPAAIEKRAERREERHERRAGRVGRLERVLLASCRSRGPSGLDASAAAALTTAFGLRRRRRGSRRRRALTSPGLPSSRCAAGERHQHARAVGGRRRRSGRSRARATVRDRAAGEDRESCRPAFAPSSSAPSRSGRPRPGARSASETTLPPARMSPKPCRPAGVAREERHARLVLPARDVLDGDRLDDHRRDAVDEPGAACGRARSRSA